MQCITDINEVFRLLSKLGCKSIYKDIGVDDDGVRIAVPLFSIGDSEPISEKGGIDE